MDLASALRGPRARILVALLGSRPLGPYQLIGQDARERAESRRQFP